MDLTYFFAIFKDDDANAFFQKFLSGKFYASHKGKVVVCVSKNDTKNLSALNAVASKNSNFKVFVCKKISYNSCFRFAMEHFEGDVLLGDAKIKNIDAIFSKCVEKHQKGAQIVQVLRKYPKFKRFFVSLRNKIYNFFVKIFTSKADSCNIVSLGLISADVVQIFKELGHKKTFLKNTSDLYKLQISKIFVDYKTPSHKQNFGEKTFAKTLSIASASLFVLTFLSTLLLNFFAKNATTPTIILIFFMLILLIIVVFCVPKHFFDCRNLAQDFDADDFAPLKIEKNVRASKKKNAKKMSVK